MRTQNIFEIELSESKVLQVVTQEYTPQGSKQTRIVLDNKHHTVRDLVADIKRDEDRYLAGAVA
jgi:transcription termination factor NusB